jgi:hypothetical protein
MGSVVKEIEGNSDLCLSISCVTINGVFYFIFPPLFNGQKKMGRTCCAVIPREHLCFPVGGGRITEPFHNAFIKCNSLEIILPLRTATA